MPTLVQRSFAKGELSPALRGRVDTVMYSLGAKKLYNAYVPEEGGADIRPGTLFINELISSAYRPKLFGFDFNNSYCLIFTALKMYVVKDGAAVIGSTKNITGISKASPGVVTSNSHGFTAGDIVYLSGIVGMTELNGRWVKVGTTATNTFQIKDLEGNNINTSSFTTYTSGGTAEKIYSITTPYAAEDVPYLHFNQSADTVTITHQEYPISDLVRTADASWALAEKDFTANILPPTALTILRDDGDTNGANNPYNQGYVVTSVNSEGEESVASAIRYEQNSFASPGTFTDISWTAATGADHYRIYKHQTLNGTLGFLGTVTGTSYRDGYPGAIPDYTVTPPVANDPFNQTATISAITRANPGVITATSHGFTGGERVRISGVIGMTEINDTIAYIDYINANSFSLQDGNLSGIDTSAYTAYSSGGTVSLLDNYPMTSGYFQERLLFANQVNKPMRVLGSRSGSYNNFSQSTPLREDDPVTFDAIGRNGGGIRHIVDVGALVILTSKGEHICQGDASGVLKPDSINRKQFSYHGSSLVQPLVAGQTVLTIQAEGSKIFHLGFDQRSGGLDGYKDGNITSTSSHFFKGYTIKDWCLQKTPNSIVWAVRSDGILLGMTFEREQEVIAWHKHETDGRIESVCCVPENGEHAIYIAVRRFINGSVVGRIFIERFYPQNVFKNSTTMFSSDLGTVYLDSSLSYDGRNTDSTNTMWLTGGSTWGHEETLTLHAANATFTSADVGKEVHLKDTNDVELVRLSITAYTSSTVVSVRSNRTVPSVLRNIGNASYLWALAVKNVTGLHHLEGKDVSVIGDSFVVGSPNNSAYGTTYSIVNGAVSPSLDKCYSVISVGLPYYADVETLDIDAAQSETLMDKKKCVSRVTLRVKDSRGIHVGASEPTGDDLLDGLNELKIRQTEDYDSANDLLNGIVDINIRPEWNSNGGIILRQVDPLPMNILTVAVSGMIPMGR